MRHKFPSIKDKGGLNIHLNDDSQKKLHRGFGYKTYRILRRAGLNVTNRAKAFNVTFDTMKGWDAEDDRERAQRKADAEAGLDSIRE